VAALDIPCAAGKYNLVDRRQRMDGGDVWQRKTDDWFIYTNSSAKEKVKRLREIAERLKIDLVVQE